MWRRSSSTVPPTRQQHVRLSWRISSTTHNIRHHFLCYLHPILGVGMFSSVVWYTLAFTSVMQDNCEVNSSTLASGTVTNIMSEKWLPNLAACDSPTLPPTSVTYLVMSETIPSRSLPTALIINCFDEKKRVCVEKKEKNETRDPKIQNWFSHGDWEMPCQGTKDIEFA